MLSTIASFFWGSKTTAPLSDAEVSPNNIKDDVIVDVITDDGLVNDILISDVLANDVLANDVLANDVLANDGLANDGLAKTNDGLVSDVLANNGPVNDAPPTGTILSTSSLSDEEAGWVFVNSKQEPTESTVSEKENEQVENEPPVTKSERKSVLSVQSDVKCLVAEPTESTVSEKENEQVENEPPVTKRERKSSNVPAPKPQNIPSSALHTSSVLNALAELRPQQKTERRHKESRLKHKQMERSNKALQVCSSSNRPNRRRFMYSPERSSRAVNNRKC